MQEILWKSKVYRRMRICALASELELRQALLIHLASRRMVFCQRDLFLQTRPDQTPGNARELLCTTASAPRATEAQVTDCTMEKADAGNRGALSSSRPSLPSLHSPASRRLISGGKLRIVMQWTTCDGFPLFIRTEPARPQPAPRSRMAAGAGWIAHRL